MPKAENLVRELVCSSYSAQSDQSMWDAVLSPSCIMSTVMGRKIGRSCLNSCRKDLFHAFPDFTTTLMNIETIGSAITCNVTFSGTHQNRFVNSSYDTGGILVESDFSKRFSELEPHGASFLHKSELVFVMEHSRISRISIVEDPTSFFRQIGLYINFEKLSNHALIKREYKLMLKEALIAFNGKLSAKECLCLAFAISGFSSKHIGELFNNSFRTIENHLQQVYWKLNCPGKTCCLELIIKMGLVLHLQELCQLALNKAKKC